MHRFASRRPSPVLSATSVIIATLVLAPLTAVSRLVAATATRLRDEEDGVSEVTSALLLAGGIAIIVIIVLGIIQPWAENEAENLPTSGD
jgi:hypothetical protein